MPDHLSIPIDAGDAFRIDERHPVGGGGLRVVKYVPLDREGKTKLPCIWRAREPSQGQDEQNQPIPVYRCILLAATDPPAVIQAEVNVHLWAHLTEGLVNW